jgi:hypothetical protein
MRAINKKPKASEEAKEASAPTPTPRWAHDSQLATYLNMSKATVHRYRAQFPDFPRPCQVSRTNFTDLNEVDVFLKNRVKGRVA